MGTVKLLGQRPPLSGPLGAGRDFWRLRDPLGSEDAPPSCREYMNVSKVCGNINSLIRHLSERSNVLKATKLLLL